MTIIRKRRRKEQTVNDIVREVYVKRKTLDSPISYIRATNAVGLKFRFCDFDIPEDTQARVYVQKPSGKAAYNDALIEGNEVKVEVTTQMFAEAGECQLQLNLVKDEKTLVTFIQTVNVCANYTEGDALKSQNESGFFTEYEEKLDTAVANANKAAETVTEQVKNAEDAALKANDAAKTATESAGMAETAAERAETAAANADTATTSAIEAAVAATGAAETAATATKEITGKAEGGGFTGTVKIGTVTTGAPGTEVKVENVGTDKDAVLDFTIPQGSTGGIENIESATIEFVEATESENIESGDEFGVIMGKIKKIISRLKAVAFSGEYRDLNEAPSLENICDRIYPIGSIYMSVDDTNPADIFGGTWEPWGVGRMPVGVDTSDSYFNEPEKTGGSKWLQSHSHTLNNHTHSVNINTNSTGAHTHGIYGKTVAAKGSTYRALGIASDHDIVRQTESGGTHYHNVSGSTGGNTGDTSDHNLTKGTEHNLSPYIACYMWKRIS